MVGGNKAKKGVLQTSDYALNENIKEVKKK